MGWLAIALLALAAFATPAFAAPKGKKAKAEASSEPQSLDDMMNSSGSGKKSSKAAKEDEPAEPEEQEEEVAEPDEWEKPPAEEEKAPPPPAPAPVEEQVGDGNQLEAGLLLGWGFNTDKAFGLDPYGLGFGARVGYELDFKLFLGVGFEYFLGESDTKNTTIGGVTTGTQEATVSYMFAHVEAGYDFWFDSVIVRPSLWLGLGFGTQDPHPLTGGRKTLTDFFMAPGASVLYVMDGIFVGGDMRYLLVTGDGASAFTVLATAGLRF